MIPFRRLPPVSALAAASALLLSVICCAAETAAPPVAEVKPVVDDYFGNKVTDPYRWFEDDKNPAFVKWLKGQADYTESVLANIPGREKLRARVQALSDSTTALPVVQVAAGRYSI